MTDTAVTRISQGERYAVETTQGTFEAKAIINAAGIHADTIHNFVGEPQKILPQRGQYYLLDNAHRGFVAHTLFQLPGKKGKGVLITPTVDENILVGPNADDADKDNCETTREGLAEVLEAAKFSVEGLPVHGRITAFAGIRAKHASHDFVIDEPMPGFFNALGIDSPGLSAAPAIAEMLAGMVTARLQPAEKADFVAKRKGVTRFSQLPFEAQEALVRENPLYGHMVCRCETVSEAEILDAIHRPVGARSLDALKRRTRAQMGRCQGGFCSLKLAEILARELGVSEESLWT